MVKIIISSNKKEVSYYSIQENPTPGSFGDYLLLKEQYKLLDQDWLLYGDSIQVRQALFNMAYLKEMEKVYGTLHCAYCGKQDLRVFEFSERKQRSIMATVDHILPRAKHPELAFTKSNLTVACDKCNTSKGENYSQIKFPYDDTRIISQSY